MPDWFRDEVRSFLRALPGIALLWALMSVVFLVWRAWEGQPPGSLALEGVALAFLFASLAPLFWLRYWRHRPYPSRLRRSLAVLALATAWLVLWMVVLLVVQAVVP